MFGGRFVGKIDDIASERISNSSSFDTGPGILRIHNRTNDIGGFLSLENVSHVLSFNSSAIAQTLVVDPELRAELCNLYKRS